MYNIFFCSVLQGACATAIAARATETRESAAPRTRWSTRATAIAITTQGHQRSARRSRTRIRHATKDRFVAVLLKYTFRRYSDNRMC